MILDDDLDPECSGASFDNVDRLGMTGGGDEESASTFFDSGAHGHGFGGGGGFVEERGIGDFESGEIDDHGLEIQKRFEAALGNFCLIGGVLSVPTGIFEDVPLNHRRGDAVVIAHADEGTIDLILGSDFFQRCKDFIFAFGGGEGKWAIETDLRRNGFVD